MKGNENSKFNKYLNKCEISSNPNINEYKYSSNSLKARKYITNHFNKEKTISPIKEVLRIPNSLKKNSNNDKTKLNNDLINSYSFKKKEGFKLKDKTENKIGEHNLSGYKKILDKMIEQFSNKENSKDNMKNLVKDCIANRKYYYEKKNKNFSPTFKDQIINENKGKMKTCYFNDHSRNKKKNKNFINQIIRIQTFWRGYYLRKIVFKGLKKYYGLIFIYKSIKKYILKRNEDIFIILFDKKIKRKCISNLSPLKNNYLYTKKFFHSNTVSNNDENDSFSFSTPNELEKNNENLKSKENNIKAIYSKSKTKEILNLPISNQNDIQNKKISNYTNKITKSYEKNIYNNKNLLMKKNYATDNNALYSNIIKINGKNSKIGEKTTIFFNKYDEKTNQTININTENCFRKPMYKKKNKKYIYIRKNICQKDQKNFSSEKSSKYSSNIISEKNSRFSQTLFNMYKFVFLKIINIIKIKCYKFYFQKFLYYLKIKRKISELKLKYRSLQSIIKLIEKKLLKKYLNIYREKILTLKANDMIKYEKPKKNNYILLKKSPNKNVLKKINKNIDNSNGNISRNSIQNKIKDNPNKKNLIIKLLKIIKKYKNNSKLKYFNIWKSRIKYFNSKNKFKKIEKIKIINKNFVTLNNEKDNKIIVNKKLLKIKKSKDKVNNSENKIGNYNNSLSKEKKMKIIKRVSNPEEYLSLYNSFNKNFKESINALGKSDIFIDGNNNKILDKIFFIIEKIESKKMLFKFFNSWKKMK